MFRLYALAACVAAVGAAYGIGRIQGYTNGQAACEARVAAERARLQDELHGVSDRLSEQVQAYTDLERNLAATRRAFNAARRADPDACRLGPDGVQRLIDRWGPAD